MSLTRVVPAMIQQATARLLGRTTAGTGVCEELTVGSGLTLSGGALSGTAASDTVSGVVELATNAETQTGTDTVRAVTPAGFRAANIVNDTAKASTSGVNVDFTDIPSWAKRVTVMLSGVSTNGTSPPIIQLGTSGGIQTSGYLSANSIIGSSVVTANFTNGFGVGVNTAQWAATDIAHGAVVFSRLTGDVWVAQGCVATSARAQLYVTSGSKDLAGTLDRVRVTTSGGADTFDAGTINVSWE